MERYTYGIYLNPGNNGFWEAVNSKIYVDKTKLISYTNELISTEQKFICISRPRRFGKSMALRMLATYYSRGCDSAELFKGRRIEEEKTFGEHLNWYDVICLNMQQFLIEAENQELTKYLEQEVIDELWEEYGEHSALNMFTEYSMTDQGVFEEYTGFTENEVKELCEQFDMDFYGSL